MPKTKKRHGYFNKNPQIEFIIKNNTMTPKVTFCIFITGIMSSVSYAQSDIGLPSSAYIDNIVDSATVEQRPSSFFQTFKSQTNALSQPLWAKRRVSFTYGFSHSDSKLTDDAKTDSNSVTPELYLENNRGFALNISLAYQHASKNDNANSHVDSNAYSVSLQPAQELLRFLVNTNSKTKLVAGISLNYGNSDAVSTSTLGRKDSDTDSCSVGPNLVLVQPINEGVTLSVIPTFVMQWKTTQSGGAETDTSAGVFSLQGRADFVIDDRTTLSMTATWKRDVFQKVAPPSTPKLQSWAEFGGSVRYGIAEKVGLRAGYSYETFNSDYSAHKASARLEVTF